MLLYGRRERLPFEKKDIDWPIWWYRSIIKYYYVYILYSQQMRNRPGVELSSLYELQLDERFQLVGIMEQVHEVLVAEVQTSILSTTPYREYIYPIIYIGDDWKSMNFVVKLFKRNNKTSSFNILSHQVKQIKQPQTTISYSYFIFSYIYTV